MKRNDFNSTKFSIALGGITNTTPLTQITISDLKTIYLDGTLIKISKDIINNDNEEERKELKLALPYITPYGTFEPIRKNEFITSYNTEILAIDIDKLSAEDLAKAWEILSNGINTLMVFITSSGKGIRALIRVEYNIEIDPLEHYHLLKFNKNYITQALGLEGFTLDLAMFVLSQPFFIFHRKTFNYFNENATPLILSLSHIEVKSPIALGVNLGGLAPQNKKDSTVLKSFEFVASKLTFYGNRHHQIAKFTPLAELIHYSPHLKEQLFNEGWKLIVQLYDNNLGEAISQNALRSYQAIWDNAKPRYLDHLENE